MRTIWKFFGHCLEWLAILMFWVIVAPLFIIMVLNYAGIIGILFIVVLLCMFFIHGIGVFLNWVFGHRDEEEKENPDDWFI